jgi:hypothetical protein
MALATAARSVRRKIGPSINDIAAIVHRDPKLSFKKLPNVESSVPVENLEKFQFAFGVNNLRLLFTFMK